MQWCYRGTVLEDKENFFISGKSWSDLNVAFQYHVRTVFCFLLGHRISGLTFNFYHLWFSTSVVGLRTSQNE